MTREPSPSADIAEARRVIGAEAAALTALAAGLDHSFTEAVDAILGATGRVVVSGMGKSGHVGRKIAATFASTGTPAQFVHPAEASHGDLGMLTREDVALVLSFSGETPELVNLVSYTRRLNIRLIGVAAVKDSALLRAADIALVLPDVEEADPLGLAPTTSSVATMALGDALAMSVMGRRSFTPQNFRMLHPGGRLGAALLRVDELMHTADAIPTVAEDAPMSEALIEMTAKGFGITGVVDAEGFLAGVITDGDLRRNMDGILDRRAGDVATADPRVAEPTVLVVEAVKIMNDAKVLCLFVVEEEPRERRRKPVGLLHIHDCLRAGIA